MPAEIEIPDPFRIPDQPSLSEEELQNLRELVQSSSWGAVVKVFEWQRRRLTSVLYNAREDYTVYQGMIKGVALAQEAIENVRRYIKTPRQSVSDAPDKEAQFFQNWEKKNKSSVSGY